MKKIIKYGLLCIVLVVSFVNFGYTQEQPSLRDRAERFYLRMEYAKALELYGQLMRSKTLRVAEVERIANSYMYLNEYEQAENWFAQALQMEDFTKEAMLGYAEALKHNNKYAQAKEVFLSYNSKYGNSKEVLNAIAGCDSAMVWIDNPAPFELKNEQDINTDLAEFAAVPTSKGVIYAAEPKVVEVKQSGMTGETYLRVFSSNRKGASMSLPSIMPYSFNTAEFHVGPVAVNKEENVLYVTRTHPGKHVQKFRDQGKRFSKHNLELMIYRNLGDDWSAEPFLHNNVSAYSVGHAALSDDERTLYFVSDMPGGYGGTDIWYCKLESDESWGNPQNAGAVINSADNEMFPSIYGDKLYYSSDGFIGMGGLDLYVATGSRNQFTGRRNLGYPLNSAADDFAYVVMADDDDAYYGYLSSNRKDGVGGDDIYSFYFEKPKINIILEASTYEDNTNELLPDVRVTLFGIEDNKIITAGVTDADGKVQLSLDKGKNYKLIAERTGYIADSTRIAAVAPQQDTLVKAELYLTRFKEKGDKIVLQNLYYDFDKSDIRPDAALVLERLVKVMMDNPTLKVELSSHTDSRGSDSYNMKLSQRRAESAVNYIVSRGIAKDRIVAKGYGESRLTNNCPDGHNCTEEQHQANRRTEAEVLDF